MNRMSRNGRVGTISNVGTSRFEWIVPADARAFIESPTFSVRGSKWCLGMKKEFADLNCFIQERMSVVSLRLRRVEDFLPTRNTKFDFVAESAEGSTHEIFEQTTVFADNEFSEYLKFPWLFSANITLTVTCTLTLCDLSNESIGNTNLAQLSEDFKELFISGKACDATVKVGETAYSVHKIVLEIRSPVFAAMFEVDMKEKDINTLEILDCEPEAFRDFLLYLYSGTTEKMSQNAFELFKISDKYNVPELKSKCLAFLMGSLNSENVLDAFVLAHKFAEVELKRKARVTFGKNFKSIVPTDKWKSFLNENTSLATDLLISMSEEIEYND